jgi:hypothetical protein
MIFSKSTVAQFILLIVTLLDSCSSGICVRKEKLNESFSYEYYGIDIDKDGRSDFNFRIRGIETRELGGHGALIYSVETANNGRLPHSKYIVPAFATEPVITDSLRNLYTWSSSSFTLAAKSDGGIDEGQWRPLWGDGKASYLIFELNYTSYGWIRLSIDTTNNSIVFHDYSYSFRCYK